MMQIGTLFAIYITPIILAFTFQIRRLNRRTTEAERNPQPFDPKPIPAPSGIFRNLSAPQRVYLAQQLKLALVLYLLLAWTELFILSMQILAPAGHAAALWSNAAARTWYLFLSTASNTSSFFTIFLLSSAFVVIIPIRMGAPALFARTRPLAIGFLYWTRVLAIVFALCAAMLTGIAGSIALLAALKGPVWHNLPANIPRIIGADDADIVHEYADLLVTSAPRIFLSLVTTMMLCFSALLALFMVPSKRSIFRASLPVVVLPAFLLAIFLPVIQLAFDLEWLHPPRILFIYAHLGPPPPYVFALGPIAISAAFLLLARIFAGRIEL